MRRRSAELLLVVAAAVLLSACNRTDTKAAEGASGRFATRTLEAGAVEVKLTPTRISDPGAAFDVVLDTHSVELDMDVAEGTRLEVDGIAWTGASWDGAEAGGHHREGTLKFDAAGPVAGRAVLTLEGLPAHVEASRDVQGGS